MGHVTLKDIALRCGVSSTLVSAVLNRRQGNITCQASVRERIHCVARELGYRPNLLARSLKNGRSHVIGLINSAMQYEVRTKEIMTLINGLLEHGYTTQVFYDRGAMGLCRKACENLIDHGCEALVIISALTDEDWNSLPQTPVPVFHISFSHPDLIPGRTVFLDFAAGCQETIRTLQTLGHRHFLFISGKWDRLPLDPRYTVFMKHYASLGQEGKDHCLLLNSIDDLTPERLRAYLAMRPETTAILASNDFYALKAINVLKHLGHACPDEFSVVGFDDIQASSLCLPSLSSVHQPVEEAAMEIVSMLLNQLDGKQLPTRNRFPCRLMQRESMGPARNTPLSL